MKKPKKKNGTKKLKTRLWDLCKTIVRKRDGNRCIICGKTNLEGSGWHTGHFLPSASCGAFLRYDLRNLHSNCYNCNINLGGNGAQFYVILVEKYGQPFVDQLFKDRNVITKADDVFYTSKIQEYENLIDLEPIELFKCTSKV